MGVQPDRLHQIIMNLCTNAWQAIGASAGSITVSAERFCGDVSLINPASAPGDYVVLRVSDTGHGISPDILERIFDPFFTTKDVGAGTGLGLSTVHGSVRRAEGFVLVHSEVGRGSMFEVYLPLVSDPKGV